MARRKADRPRTAAHTSGGNREPITDPMPSPPAPPPPAAPSAGTGPAPNPPVPAPAPAGAPDDEAARAAAAAAVAQALGAARAAVAAAQAAAIAVQDAADSLRNTHNIATAAAGAAMSRFLATGDVRYLEALPHDRELVDKAIQDFAAVAAASAQMVKDFPSA
jgi:hypothetical protein